MARNYGMVVRAMTCFSLVSLLVGCADPDRRLIADEASCQRMGHFPDTQTYKGCLKDLNDRRCAVVARKGWTQQHVASADCTRIN